MTPDPDSPAGLPPELVAHVELCGQKGLDLLPWLDPYREPPPRPILQRVETFQDRLKEEGRPESWVTTAMRIVTCLIEDEDLFDDSDLLPAIVRRWIWSQVRNYDLRVNTAKKYVRVIHNFAREFVEPTRQDLLDLRAVHDSRGIPLEKQVAILQFLESRPDERAFRVAKKFGVAHQSVKALRERGAPLATATRLYCTEEPQWRARAAAYYWLWKDRYDAFGADTYRSYARILAEHNDCPEAENSLLGADAPLRLPAGSPDDRYRSRSRIKNAVQYCRRVEDEALHRVTRQAGAVGSGELLKASFAFSHGAEESLLCGSPRACIGRWNDFPERIKVAVGGWKWRWKFPEGRRGQYSFRRLVRCSKREMNYGEAKDLRGVWLDKKMAEDGLTLREARIRWNTKTLAMRKKLSPGCPKKINTISTARELLRKARQESKRKISFSRKNGSRADDQQWPRGSEEEEFRRLHDDCGWSYNRIAREKGVSCFKVYYSVWRARVDHNPRETREKIRNRKMYQIERRALELWDEGKPQSDLLQVLVEEGFNVGSHTCAWVSNLLQRARFWRALERRAEELLAKVESKPSDGQPTRRKAASPTVQAVAHTTEPPTSPKEPEPHLQWLTNAMLLVRDHPEWSDRRIATEVGKNPGTISRSREYQFAAALARGEKTDRPRGVFNSATGEIDAFAE